DGVSMTADPFGSGLYDDIGAVFNRSAEISRRGKRVVDDQRKIMFLCQCAQRLEVRNIEAGVADRFHVKGFRLFVDQFFVRFRPVVRGKAGLNANALERNLELVVGSSIEEGGGDKVLTRL